MLARKVVVTVLGASLLLLLFYLLFLVIQPFIYSFMWASIIVILTWPLYRHLNRRIKRPSLTAAIATFLVIIFLLIPFYYFISRLVNEVTALYPHVQERINDPAWIESLKQNHTYNFILTNGQAVLDKLNISFAKITTSLSSGITSTVTHVFTNSFKFAFRIIMVVVFLFILYRDGPRIINAIREFIPLCNARIIRLEKEISTMLQAIFYGVFFTAILQGVMGGIGFAVLGLGSPLFFGSLMAFFALFPVGGAAIIWLPAALILMITDHWIKALILLAWGAILVSSLDNVVRPFLIAGKSNFPLILVFIGALGGIVAFGFMGVFVGPIILTITGHILLLFEEILYPKPPPPEVAEGG